jgi:hypothetical protein
VEYAERDEKEGRILVRPAVGRNLPFGDGFEKLLLAWSFLNVMGYVLSFPFYFHSPSQISSRIQLRQGLQRLGTKKMRCLAGMRTTAGEIREREE